MRVDAFARPIVDATRPEKPSELERRNGGVAERLDRKDMADVRDEERHELQAAAPCPTRRSEKARRV